MSGIEFNIVEHIATISKRGKWTLELNRVSWNKNPPKLDLRSWSEDHEKCSKGINLTHDEALALREILNRIV